MTKDEEEDQSSEVGGRTKSNYPQITGFAPLTSDL
jgi:hypothetical protein